MNARPKIFEDGEPPHVNLFRPGLLSSFVIFES